MAWDDHGMFRHVIIVPSAGVRGEHPADAPEQVRSVRGLLRLRPRPRPGVRSHLQAHRGAERRHEAEGEVKWTWSAQESGCQGIGNECYCRSVCVFAFAGVAVGLTHVCFGVLACARRRCAPMV